MKHDNPLFSILNGYLKTEAPKFLNKLSNQIKEVNVEEIFNSFVEEIKPTTSTEDTDIKELVEHYTKNIHNTFMHKRKKTKYILIDIINKESTDQVKFPISAVYLDKQTKTKWCRPLIEFHSNFKIIL